MHQKLFTSQIVFFMSASCGAILSLNWKNNTILLVSKIQTMRKLNDPTATSFRVFQIAVRGGVGEGG